MEVLTKLYHFSLPCSYVIDKVPLPRFEIRLKNEACPKKTKMISVRISVNKIGQPFTRLLPTCCY